jgi:cation transport ATPase
VLEACARHDALQPKTAHDLHALPGRGIEGVIGAGTCLRLGSSRWMEELEVAPWRQLRDRARGHTAGGRPHPGLADATAPAAPREGRRLLAFGDTVEPECATRCGGCTRWASAP